MSLTALQLVNEHLSRVALPEVSTLGETGDADIALRRINMAQQMISTAHPFVWAEKTSPGQITAVAGTSVYSLATDVAHIIGAKHTYQGGGWIDFKDRKTLEMYRADRTQTADRNTPRIITTAGLAQATAATPPALRAEFWPVPGSDFAGQIIEYFYTFILTDLSADSDISLIPGDYHWLLVEMAETLQRRGPIRTGGDGAQSQIDLYAIADRNVKDGLKKLISRDSAVASSEMTWEVDAPSI